MINNKIQPRQALNKGFLRIKPIRNEFEIFKRNLITLINQIDENEREEFHKNILTDFFKNTYYGADYLINIKASNDLVIYNGKDNKSSVGLILEAKKVNNNEMLKVDNLNTKALQQLVLYFLRERITNKNPEIKYLIATNIYEWFVFDATIFENLFAQNTQLVKQFNDFEEKRLSNSRTDFFYKEIAQPAIDEIQNQLVFTHFDIRDYQQYLINQNPENDQKLIPLFKLFSPQHLLKIPTTNDSNSLNKNFYSELLHILGLTEIKEGSKKLIQRKSIHEREQGSLIENTITRLQELRKIDRLENSEQFGENTEDRLFNVSLELVITWINRILFLKLLESQLINYHQGNKSFAFLNLAKIQDFGNLNRLFFGVLSHKPEEREKHIKNLVANIPYLNSSLFEVSEIEHQTIVISNLVNDEKLSIFNQTVLKDNHDHKRTGKLKALEYIFEFLDAYDFSSEGTEEIQEESKTLINASVLGLIFEKINGYKDGSFFTPGFITMYMCRETIRRAVLQKFKEIKGWNCKNIDELYDIITDKKEANQIINSLKICDPAVGSGHFLVSALNEIITIKSELKILLDKQGRTLRDYHLEIENDELIITDDDGKFFRYNPKNPESRRIQETLFYEKQTIIENCLFGVDINPNSVKICRLRLWIELLKNAYYQTSPLTSFPQGEGNLGELQTLPNIDINIKTGNSLISRFPLNWDLRTILKKSDWNIESYRNAIKTYLHPDNKDQKQEMERLINDIKGNISTEISSNDPNIEKRNQKIAELRHLRDQKSLFVESKAEAKSRQQNQEKLQEEINQLNAEIEDKKSGKFYQNAFEWRFEFPEVLNDEGDFIGFDVVIGNPPYGISINRKSNPEYTNIYSEILIGEIETYIIFYYRGLKLLHKKGRLAYITPDSWVTNSSAKTFRSWLQSNFDIFDVFDYYKPFADAKDTRCHSLIIEELKSIPLINIKQVLPGSQNLIYRNYTATQDEIKSFSEKEWRLYLTNDERNLVTKMDDISEPLERNYNLKYGLRTGNNKKYISETPGIYPLIAGADIADLYAIKWKPKYLKTITGLPSTYFNEYFSTEKIIIQRIRTNSLDMNARWLECAYIIGDYIPMDSLSYVYQKNSEHDIKFLLSILNSKLMNKYYRFCYTDVNVKPTYLNQLPIPDISIDNQQPFVSLVNQILAIKQVNPNGDTTALEQEIDQLVYQLYGLTEEEIQIVEAKTN